MILYNHCRIWFLLLLFCSHFVSGQNPVNAIEGKQETRGIQLAVFDIDATPPVGSMLAYDTMENNWDLGLRAKGLVLLGAGAPIVLCAIDWIGIANESQDAFKEALAEAANTVPGRVAVHTLHQHDAPICDFGAEKILQEAGLNPGRFEGDFGRQFIQKLKGAVKTSLVRLQPVTHIGVGEAAVRKVASNRRLLNMEWWE